MQKQVLGVEHVMEVEELVMRRRRMMKEGVAVPGSDWPERESDLWPG